MWTRSFHERLPSKTESGRYEKDWKRSSCARHASNCQAQVGKTSVSGRESAPPGKAETFLRTARVRQTFPIHLPRKVLSSKHNMSCIRPLKKTQFSRDVPQKVHMEEVKTTLSCKTSLKEWQLKMSKRSFCGVRRQTGSGNGWTQLTQLTQLTQEA